MSEESVGGVLVPKAAVFMRLVSCVRSSFWLGVARR